MRIYQVESDEDHDHVRELFWEYLVWANAGLNEAFAINLDIAELQESAMSKLQVFFPPQGRLLLVEADGRMAGVACMH